MLTLRLSHLQQWGGIFTFGLRLSEIKHSPKNNQLKSLMYNSFLEVEKKGNERNPPFHYYTSSIKK